MKHRMIIIFSWCRDRWVVVHGVMRSCFHHVSVSSVLSSNLQRRGVLDANFKRNIYATYEPGKLRILVRVLDLLFGTLLHSWSFFLYFQIHPLKLFCAVPRDHVRQGTVRPFLAWLAVMFTSVLVRTRRRSLRPLVHVYSFCLQGRA